MNDLPRLLDALSLAADQGQEAVIATVVKVEGSAYRRPGARMVVAQLGAATGTVSGGCLESDVSKKAWWFTATGRPALRSYSTGQDDDDLEEAELSFGLGCNGTVHILFERVPANGDCLVARVLREVRDSWRPGLIATVIGSDDEHPVAIGERVALAPGSGRHIEMRDQSLAARILEDLQTVHTAGRSATRLYDCASGVVEVLLEYIPAPRRLVLFGAGHDAQPLVNMASLQGWHTTVIDARPQYARAERFPGADRVIAAPLAPLADLPAILDGAAVVVMTHSLAQDRFWLDVALHGAPLYIGQLGPRSRTERLLDEMEQPRRRAAFARLHYPVGLDTGGDTPDCVALSILGEINAVLNDRDGGMLKNRTSSIHAVHMTLPEEPALRLIG